MTAINLLPWRARRRERRKRAFAVQLAAAVALAVAVVVAADIWQDDRIHEQRLRIQRLAAQTAEVDARIAEIGLLRAERETIRQRTAALARLGDHRHTLVRVLDGLAGTLVPGVYYTALAKRGEVVAAQGVAESNDGIAALMRNLRDSPLFAEPTLKSIAEADAGTTPYGEQATAFEMSFEVAAPAALPTQQTQPSRRNP